MWEPGWVDGEQKQAFAVVPAGTQEGWNSYRIMRTVEDFYDKVFTENGGRYLFDAPLTGLVMDDGAVVGIEVEQDGEKAFVKANKGVILACGGFTNNIAMLKAYCPRGFSGVMVNTAGIYDNGGYGACSAQKRAAGHGDVAHNTYSFRWRWPKPLSWDDGQYGRMRVHRKNDGLARWEALGARAYPHGECPHAIPVYLLSRYEPAVIMRRRMRTRARRKGEAVCSTTSGSSKHWRRI